MKLPTRKITEQNVAEWLDCAARWCLLLGSIIALGLLVSGVAALLWKAFNHDIVVFLMVLTGALVIPSTFWIMVRDPNQ